MRLLRLFWNCNVRFNVFCKVCKIERRKFDPARFGCAWKQPRVSRRIFDKVRVVDDGFVNMGLM